MKILSPFGPKIAVIKIPLNLVKKINDEVESIIKDKKKSKSSDYSKKLVGQVEQEIELKNKFIKKNLKSFISKSVNQYLKKNLNKKSKNIKIKNLWVVRQFKNDYNPIHFHDGNVSGVGYLKIPNNLTKGNKKIKTNGTIVTLQGRGNPMINALKDAQVELYHNNSKKIETDGSGVTVTGTVAATSYTGDGSALTGIEVGLSTASAQVSGITTVIDLSKDDIRLDCTGLVTVDAKGGTEGGSHSLRIVNSGIATVTFNSYFKFPSGGAPNLPTASGAISLISFTVHTQGRVGVASVFLAGSSVNFS